jgi:hypothetical protein
MACPVVGASSSEPIGKASRYVNGDKGISGDLVISCDGRILMEAKAYDDINEKSYLLHEVLPVCHAGTNLPGELIYLRDLGEFPEAPYLFLLCKWPSRQQHATTAKTMRRGS